MQKIRKVMVGGVIGVVFATMSNSFAQQPQAPQQEKHVLEAIEEARALTPKVAYEVGLDSQAQKQQDAAYNFKAGTALDESAYSALLEKLDLTDYQRKLWGGVALGYQLKSQVWPHYGNNVGTLAMNKQELAAIKAKVAEFPADVQMDSEIVSGILLPREFAVVSLEKFYEALTPQQVEMFEQHIHQMLRDMALLEQGEAQPMNAAPEAAPAAAIADAAKGSGALNSEWAAPTPHWEP